MIILEVIKANNNILFYEEKRYSWPRMCKLCSSKCKSIYISPRILHTLNIKEEVPKI
jgi:hypothetical protein